MSDDSTLRLLAATAAGVAALAGYLFVKQKQDSLKLDYDCPKMLGRTVIVTGANTGLGKSAALQIAKAGGDVVLACRNPDKCTAAAVELRNQLRTKSAGKVHTMQLDLSSLQSVRSFVKDFEERHEAEELPPLYALVNNAGAMFDKLDYNDDGVEMSFATNYLGSFLLTRLLLPTLAKNAIDSGAQGQDFRRGRIVNVSSRLEKRGILEIEAGSVEPPWLFQKKPEQCSEKGQSRADAQAFSLWRAYGTSKLAQLLFTYELQRRLDSYSQPPITSPGPLPELDDILRKHGASHDGIITTNAVTPGVVNTELGRFAPWWFKAMSWPMRSFMMRQPKEAAKTQVMVATDPTLEGIGGKYFGECKEVQSSTASYDLPLARGLWRLSEMLIQTKKD